jgi:hypothetical protein
VFDQLAGFFGLTSSHSFVRWLGGPILLPERRCVSESFSSSHRGKLRENMALLKAKTDQRLARQHGIDFFEVSWVGKGDG